MTTRLAPWLLAACTLLGGVGVSFPVQARNSTLSELSVLPLASVAVAGSAVVDSVVAVPLALSMGGAVLVVKAVESTARGTVYLLERVSDGAQASVEVLGKASLAVGTAVNVSVVGAGVVLSVAGQAVAFIPNALGRALMHNERLTD